MLSILASELVALAGHQVQCGLSLCQGKNEAAINIFASENTEELLCALAAYQPLPDERQGDEGEILPQIPVFDEPPLFAAAQRIGRFYYIAYDSTCLETRSLPHRLGCAQLSLLTYVPAVPLEEFEVICLQSLKEAKHG